MLAAFQTVPPSVGLGSVVLLFQAFEVFQAFEALANATDWTAEGSTVRIRSYR